MTWLGAFLLTQTLELPVWLLAQRSGPDRWVWRVAIGLGASGLTHPIVWFVLPILRAPLGGWGYFGVAEAFAVLAEAGFVGWFGVKRPLAWSLLANTFSASVGLSWWWVRS